MAYNAMRITLFLAAVVLAFFGVKTQDYDEDFIAGK